MVYYFYQEKIGFSRAMLVDQRVLIPIHIPSLTLTFCAPKNQRLEDNSFPFGSRPMFRVSLLLVSGRVVGVSRPPDRQSTTTVTSTSKTITDTSVTSTSSSSTSTTTVARAEKMRKSGGRKWAQSHYRYK